jgi:hypothetical protein
LPAGHGWRVPLLVDTEPILMFPFLQPVSKAAIRARLARGDACERRQLMAAQETARVTVN